MGMVVRTNTMALNAYRQLGMNNSAVAKSLEKLSSGFRINRAGDDAAGLAISEKMKAQITGLETASANAQDGISLIQTAEGNLTEVHSMLNRMVELATKSANGTYTSTERDALQDEVDALLEEIDRISQSANFNGTRLLDGSLDSEKLGDLSDASAISNITTSEFKASGASPAFSATYITNRPEAATKQTNASFSVSFDDVQVGAGTTTNTKFTVTIGDTNIEVDTNAKNALTGADIAGFVVKSGVKAGTAANVAEHDDSAASTTNTAATHNAKSETATWDKEATTAAAAGGDADCKYVKIDGHWYKMAVDGTNTNTVNFTQVDYMGESGEIIHPDYDVAIKMSAGDGKMTGTTNWQVQNPKSGLGIGSSHQAQASVEIDFAQLKDGDILTVGNRNYAFKIGASSTTAAPATNGNLVDLSDIFKTESDLLDADKQKLAIDRIALHMNTGNVDGTAANNVANPTWSVGNAGYADGKGILTFQSLSSYTDDSTTAALSATNAIGGNTTAGAGQKCDMRTQAGVMAQFYSKREDTPASVSFELDVTKIKDGDTFTINGTTFEFTDGTVPSDKKNIAIDLSSYGIAGGVQAYQQANVMKDLKDKIEATLGTANFGTTVDGNKLTMTSKNVGGTTVDESRTPVTVELPKSAFATGSALTLQIGDTADDFNKMSVNIADMSTKGLGLDGLDITTADKAKASIDKVRTAINTVSTARAGMGALQNRLEHTINNLDVAVENLSAANSRIRDTDMAKEMMNYTKMNVLVQSAQAMLAQANQQPQSVLQLLQ